MKSSISKTESNTVMADRNRRLACATLLPFLRVAMMLGRGPRCLAQAQDQSAGQMAKSNSPSGSNRDASAPDTGASSASRSVQPPKLADQEITTELDLMRARIDQLERELKERDAAAAVENAQQTPQDSYSAAQNPPVVSKGEQTLPTQPTGPSNHSRTPTGRG